MPLQYTTRSNDYCIRSLGKERFKLHRKGMRSQQKRTPPQYRHVNFLAWTTCKFVGDNNQKNSDISNPKKETKEHDIRRELLFVSLEAKLLIRDLLHKDPLKRLGSQRGAHDIKNHPFFRDIKWSLVRNMTPPPLENPLSITSSTPELDDNNAELEWDDFEAASTFGDTF